MSTVSKLIEDVIEFFQTGKSPAPLATDAQKLLADVAKVGAGLGALAPDAPGLLADVEAAAASMTVVVAARGLNLPADITAGLALKKALQDFITTYHDFEAAAGLAAHAPAVPAAGP